MKNLKKPVIACILSAIIVLSSTFISADIKLSRASDKVTEGFYRGVEFGGYKRKSVSSQLENICGAVSGLMTIAKNQGLDTAGISSLNAELSSCLSAKSYDISSVYSSYSSLRSSLEPLLDTLSAADLSKRDEKGAKDYMVTIMGAEKVIEESGYNESVQDFIDSMSVFPTDFFFSVTGTALPEKFE